MCFSQFYYSHHHLHCKRIVSFLSVSLSRGENRHIKIYRHNEEETKLYCSFQKRDFCSGSGKTV